MNSLDKIKRFIPSSVRRRVIFPVINQIGAFLIDSGTRILGQYDDRSPPTRKHFVGNGDFKAVGYEFLRYFIQYGKLAPDEDLLDVGCGIGRMALPLTNYLKQGTYTGIDIVPAGIEWCQQNITSRHPNFSFQVADIYNEAYNHKGRYKASEYRFPFDDRSFDFVLLTSVFTHLLPVDAAHYLSEIGRVLRPGGRVFGTWFVLNDESTALIQANSRVFQLVHPLDGAGEVRTTDPSIPEAAIGFAQPAVHRMHEAAGLTITDPIRYGSWCGRPEFLSYQDIVIATKP